MYLIPSDRSASQTSETHFTCFRFNNIRFIVITLCIKYKIAFDLQPKNGEKTHPQSTHTHTKQSECDNDGHFLIIFMLLPFGTRITTDSRFGAFTVNICSCGSDYAHFEHKCTRICLIVCLCFFFFHHFSHVIESAACYFRQIVYYGFGKCVR